MTTQEAFKSVTEKIQNTGIQEDPYPHIIIDEIFPPDFYRNMLNQFPSREHFKKVSYPGTGYGKRAPNYHDYGYACIDIPKDSLLHEVQQFLRSSDFTRPLLEKFSQANARGETPIPKDKHVFFKGGATDFNSVFDLHLDLPGYMIPPHADVSSKIVTFQFYLTEDASLRDYGTILCKPKNGQRTVNRSRINSSIGKLITRCAAMIGMSGDRFHRFAHSPMGVKFGVGDAANWIPWELLDIVKIAPALPNHFLAFAPNDHTYHAVQLDIPSDNPIQERRVIRGFIRSGRDSKNWIKVEEKM